MKHLGLWNVWLAVTAVVVTSGLLVVYRSSFPPQVPLWYSRPWGQDQLTTPAWLWLVPGLIAAVASVSWAGWKWLFKEELLANIWIIGGMAAQLILALAIIRVVWLMVF